MLKIPLTQGKFAIVGPRDYKYLMQWKWCCHNAGYAVRTDVVTRRTVLMHRVILERTGCEDFEYTDHINRDRLDNRRGNLRPATRHQNGCNCSPRDAGTSNYTGVRWHKRAKKWQARITVNKKEKYLGLFKNREEAKRIRDEAAKKFHGKFAVLNEV